MAEKPKFSVEGSDSSDNSLSPQARRKMKYILVTGGVISGVGKGIITSSLGVILRAHGLNVSVIKIDPYLNLDAGTFSPYEHGEVFVLDDGGEVDLDLGNYERFLDCRLRRDNNITTGKIYTYVMQKERRGDYLGKTVQVIPHITDAIMEWVERIAAQSVDLKDKTKRPDLCIIELGGTIGDIEGRPFVEAFRQFQFRAERENFMNVHVSLIVETGPSSEQKTKPTQNSVATLRGEGLWPDLVVCRSREPISKSVHEKLRTFCDYVPIINIYNVSNIYHVPILLHTQNVLDVIRKRLGFNIRASDPVGLDQFEKTPYMTERWRHWMQLARACDEVSKPVTIALVGKYVELTHEAYTSVAKALQHAAISSDRKLTIEWVPSEHLENHYKTTEFDKYNAAWATVKAADGILVPGGFGQRGIEGKIAACRYAREHKRPFLGVCLGMQCAVIEYARNVCGITGAHSTEFEQHLTSDQQLIIDMPEHSGGDFGGTMRLGKRTTAFLTKASVLRQLYGSRVDEAGAVDERHRHRYEVNPQHICQLTRNGLRFVGLGVDEGGDASTSSPSRSRSAKALFNVASRGNTANGFDALTLKDDLLEKLTDICEHGALGEASIRVEICEIADHPYFVGVQFHPEYLSHPMQPSAPYLGLVLAASGELQSFLHGKTPSSNFSFARFERDISTTRLKLLAEKITSPSKQTAAPPTRPTAEVNIEA